MITGSLAKRYARALFGLGTTATQREKFLADLDAVTAAAKVEVAGGSLSATLAANHIPVAMRLGIIRSVASRLSIDPTVLKFLELLVERGRISGLVLITRQFRDFVDADVGRVRATVRSARPLAADAARQLESTLATATGKSVILESVVDAELIGGLVTQVGSYTIDGSVRTSLDNLRHALKGGS